MIRIQDKIVVSIENLKEPVSLKSVGNTIQQLIEDWVCLQSSLEIIVALLGILKAGLVYVPLDPRSPPCTNFRVW